MRFSLSASARALVAFSASSFSRRSCLVISTMRDILRSSSTRMSSVLASWVARELSSVTARTSASYLAFSSCCSCLSSSASLALCCWRICFTAASVFEAYLVAQSQQHARV